MGKIGHLNLRFVSSEKFISLVKQSNENNREDYPKMSQRAQQVNNFKINHLVWKSKCSIISQI